MAKLKNMFQSFLIRGGALSKEACDDVTQLDPPDYEPFYMLAHGMKALEISGDTVRYKTKEELRRLLLRPDKKRILFNSRPFLGPDSNSICWKNPVAGHG